MTAKMDADSSLSTTRTLVLMRHAKSDWADESLSDHDRPLNARGRRDAPKMARWLSEIEQVPDLVLCSSAARTTETTALMIDQWSCDPDIRYTKDLYLAAPQTIVDVITRETNEESNVLVLAHNPGMAYLVSTLAGQSMDMPTAAMGIFAVDFPWYALSSSSRPEMIEFMRPKALGGS